MLVRCRLHACLSKIARWWTSFKSLIDYWLNHFIKLFVFRLTLYLLGQNSNSFIFKLDSILQIFRIRHLHTNWSNSTIFLSCFVKSSKSNLVVFFQVLYFIFLVHDGLLFLFQIIVSSLELIAHFFCVYNTFLSKHSQMVNSFSYFTLNTTFLLKQYFLIFNILFRSLHV